MGDWRILDWTLQSPKDVESIRKMIEICLNFKKLWVMSVGIKVNCQSKKDCASRSKNVLEQVYNILEN